jgi:hypothetical protein
MSAMMLPRVSVVSRVGARRRRQHIALACMALAWLGAAASVAVAAPVTEPLGEIAVDYSAGTVEVPGTGAADMHAPNAQVGRLKAERTARAAAARRLLEALHALPRDKLGCDPARAAAKELLVDPVVAQAQPAAIEWGSDGSVTLSFKLPLAALAPAAPSPGGRRRPPASAILVDAKARPTLFRSDGPQGICREAPRYFETVAEAQAALPAAKVLDASARKRDGYAIVAVAKRDAGHAATGKER